MQIRYEILANIIIFYSEFLNFEKMTSYIFFSTILLLLGVLLYVKKNSYKTKGSLGEKRVSTELLKLPKDEFIIQNNILLIDGSLTSQIDHIVISKTGIFVIETKNYSGLIYGHENAEYWTQFIFRYKSKFRNPIKQNWSHIYAIKNILTEFKNIKYVPIVVFAGTGKIKGVTSKYPIIYLNELINTIKNFCAEENLSSDQIKHISYKLSQNNITTRDTTQYHLEKVKTKVKSVEENIDNKICPRCGSPLALRHGKFGKFYGCKNYPKCRFTINE